MKRFLVTSPRFTGTAEIVYNSDGILCRIDCTDTDMDANTIYHFKAKVHPEVEHVAANFSSNVTIVAAAITVTFEMFWTKYSHKVNRLRSLKLWEKLPEAEKIEAYFAIDGYRKHLKALEWKNIQDPDTYLRNKTYKNEYK